MEKNRIYLEKFKSKLFDDNDNKKSLFDVAVEFKPGIFLTSLIRGTNLILKNIYNSFQKKKYA